MAYVAPELTLIGQASGLVLGDALTKQDSFPGLRDSNTLLENEW